MPESPPEIERDSATKTMIAEEDRNIKAELAPRMQTLMNVKRVSDIPRVVADGLVGYRSLVSHCSMMHGDVAPANLLCYYPSGLRKVIGVLNDFDVSMSSGRHLESTVAQQLAKSRPIRNDPGAAADSDVAKSHEEVISSLD